MIDTVWLVESGEYSAYEVRAVCLSETDAAEACRRANAAHGGDTYWAWSYSERPVIGPDDVVMMHTGTYDRAEDKMRAISPVSEVDIRQNEGAEDRGLGWGFHVNAVDPERLEKIARDHLAKRKAEEAGL